jgi:spermidine synthase
VVELEPAVVEASRFFNHVNHRPLEDPRTRLRVNDGRNFLLTTRDRYDVIISEPSNPWMTGVSNLFTQNFFQLGRSRLREGGIFCQWLQLYGMDPAMLRTAIRTFQSVFPYVLIFQAIGRDLLLLGSERPVLLDLPRLEAQLSVPDVAEDLRRVGIGGPYDLLAKFTLGTEEVETLTAGVPINTDDNALIEFGAPRTLYVDTTDANIRQLANLFRGVDGYVRPPLSAVDMVRLAQRYLAHGRSSYARALAQQALGREESAETHRVVDELLLNDHQEANSRATLTGSRTRGGPKLSERQLNPLLR